MLCRRYEYLLILVCNYSRWPKPFTTKTEKVTEVYRVLLREISPRYWMPITIGSNNGPAFVAEISQKLTKELKIRTVIKYIRDEALGKLGG